MQKKACDLLQPFCLVHVWRFLKKTEIPRRFLKKTAIPIIKMGNSADLEIDLPLLRRRGHFYIEKGVKGFNARGLKQGVREGASFADLLRQRGVPPH